MKISRKLIRIALIRLLALAVTLALVPSSLCMDIAHAAASDSISDPGQSTVLPDQQNIVEDKIPDMGVYKNGERYEAEITKSSGWQDETVTGSYEPTLNAISTEEYNKDVIKIPAEKNLYTLTVSTGLHPGTTVEYFAVRYIDVHNIPQTKYIFPNGYSGDAIRNYIDTLPRYEEIKVGYYVSGRIAPGIRNYNINGTRYSEGDWYTHKYATYEEYMADEENYGFDNLFDSGQYLHDDIQKKVSYPFTDTLKGSHDILRKMGYKVNEPKDNRSFLTSWSVDEMLFKTNAEIKNITNIEVFMSGGKWSVQGMTVSKVETISGYGEYGFYSGKYFLALGKHRIAELLSKKGSVQTFSAGGDTLFNIGGASSAYYSLRQLNDSSTAVSPFDDLYSFRIDLNDQIDGGLESLLRNDASDSDPAAGAVVEDLVLEIEYKDNNNWTRSVAMPVLLSMIGQYKASGDSVKTIGLAQRGDMLAFTACLPEYKSLVSAKIYVGKSARDRIKTTGGIEPAVSDNAKNAVIARLDNDPVRIAGVSMYKGTSRMSNTPNGKDTATGNELASYSYTFAFLSDAPSYYFTTTNPSGIRINPGTSESFRLTPYNGKAPIIGASYEGNVIIRLKTDSVEGANASGTIKIRLRYQDSSGTELVTPFYTVSEEVMKYIGYWPTNIKAEDNFAYYQGVQRSGIVEFPISISDVAAVTNVELSLGRDSDEWQAAGISIASIDNIGKRRIYAQENSVGDVKSEYRIVRSMDKTVIPPFPIDLKLLFSPGDSYSFSTGTGTVFTSRELDFESVRYSMTYEQTQEDLGFVRERKIYDVTVKVADDPDASNLNGDSGSRNHFYFQLRFKGGTSAFVLANQQLSSDAFRAGCEEMFTIKVNRDYGELTSLRIIPEDVSEDSDVFDKLNIEYIAVTERTTGGTADQYVIDNVGWIGIDYYDKSQDYAVKLRAGRSLNDISKKLYTVSYKQKVINFLCEIDTQAWDSDYLPVEGSISCDLEYVDIDDQPRTVSFDVVSRLASYMNKVPRSVESSANLSEALIYSNLGTITDPNWMLRPHHFDRFILPSLANVKSLKSMTFIATSRNNKPGKWVIGGLTISKIKSDSGLVTLSSNGEYYRSMETDLHCSMVHRSGVDHEELLLPAGETQKLTIYFDENTVTWSESSSWSASVSKFPESTNDSINVFVYPSERTRNIENETLSIAAQYTISNSRVMQAKQSVMNIFGSGTAQAMFYYTGLDAKDMKNLLTLSLKCSNTKISFDHAIVQQIRDNVVIRTYTLNYGSASASFGLRAQPSPSTKVYEPRKQTLMLSFTPETKEMSLFGLSDENLNPNDIAVALKYRSTLDNSGTEYYTPYVYLTEAGITKVTPGLMAEIPFDTPYLSEITGYKIISFGAVDATVGSALALNYSYDSKDKDGTTQGDTLLQTFSFDKTYGVANTPKEHEVTAIGMNGEGSVVPAEIAFTTAKPKEGQESGINKPVAAEFSYIKTNGETDVMFIPDLRRYIQLDETQLEKEDKEKKIRSCEIYQQFMTGKTATVRFFLQDCLQLVSIRLIPSEGSWVLDSITGSLRFGADPVNRTVESEINESGKLITVKNVTMSTIVTAGGIYRGPAENHIKNVSVSGGDSVEATIIINNGSGFDVSADWYVNGIKTEGESGMLYKRADGFTYIAPVNTSTVPQTYTITVWPIDNPSLKDVINVSVPVPPPQQNDPPPAGNTENTENNSGENDAEQNTGENNENNNDQGSGDEQP